MMRDAPSHGKMTTPVPSITEPFNLADYVLNARARDPDKAALEIVGPNQRDIWTYAALSQAVSGIARGLHDLGFKPGDRVLLRLSNQVEFPLAYLGAITAGLVPVPTSAQLTQAEITTISQMVAPAVIIADGTAPLPHPNIVPVLSVADLRAMFDLPPRAPVLGDPNRLAYIIFTSGTSGRAKGVCHAHRAITARQMMWRDWYALRPDDRLMHSGAFNWTYTLGTGLMDPWSIGATAVIPAAGVTPAELPDLITGLDVTIFAAAPGVFRQGLRATKAINAPTLRHGLSAGEKLPASVANDWRAKTGTEVHEALGMSEISTFISSAPARPAPEGSSGYPQTGRQIAVLDAKEQPLGPDTPGELAVSTKDPGLMIGYLGEPPLAQDWFRTGDMVCQAPDGSITYLGRSDDMMNAGGFRVSPLEVERAFSNVEGLGDLAATSVEIKPDTFVIALFYTAPAPLEEAALRAHAHQTLAHYKQPRLYIHRSSLPKGPNGKMNRRKLRAEFEAPHGET